MIGQALVHLVGEFLGLDEKPAVPGLEGLERMALANPVLPTPGGPTKTMLAAWVTKSSSASGRQGGALVETRPAAMASACKPSILR